MATVGFQKPRRGFDREGDYGHRLGRWEEGERIGKVKSESGNLWQDVRLP